MCFSRLFFSKSWQQLIWPSCGCSWRQGLEGGVVVHNLTDNVFRLINASWIRLCWQPLIKPPAGFSTSARIVTHALGLCLKTSHTWHVTFLSSFQIPISSFYYDTCRMRRMKCIVIDGIIQKDSYSFHSALDWPLTQKPNQLILFLYNT